MLSCGWLRFIHVFYLRAPILVNVFSALATFFDFSFSPAPILVDLFQGTVTFKDSSHSRASIVVNVFLELAGWLRLQIFLVASAH